MNGLIHIYTGDGKGKTTAACGLILRALGNGFKVLVVQFLKGTPSGEIEVLERLTNITILRNNLCKKFLWDMNDIEKEAIKKECCDLLERVINFADNYDMLVLDECMAAISTNMIEKEAVIQFLNTKPSHLEVIMTGRNVPKELIAVSDYVSEIKVIKHPMDKGINARRGIEF